MVSTGHGEPANGRADVRSDRIDLTAAVGASLPSAGRAALVSLARTARLATLRRADVLVGQGAAGALVLVIDGWIALRRLSDRGRPLIVDVVGSGRLAGMIAPGRSPFELQAVTAGTAAVWPAADVVALAAGDPALGRDLAGHASDELDRVVVRLDRVAFEGVRERVCRALLERREICFDPVRPVLSRGDLAALVGASREMTNRVLRDLEAAGAIRRQGAHGLTLRRAAVLERTIAVSGPVGRRAVR